MFPFLLSLNLWTSSVYSATVVGNSCSWTNTTSRVQHTGECLPLDSDGYSWPCSDIFGFLVLDVCAEQYGDSMNNVPESPSQAVLIATSMLAVYRSHARQIMVGRHIASHPMVIARVHWQEMDPSLMLHALPISLVNSLQIVIIDAQPLYVAREAPGSRTS